MNVSLFIKRAELHQDEQFIKNVFHSKQIGMVSDVKFIKKMSENGKSYNGVIVNFENWYSSTYAHQLLDNLTSAKDETCRFFVDKNVFWFVSIHRQKIQCCQEIKQIDPSLSDKQRIVKLEELVNNLSTQLYYMQKKQENTEQQLMKNEQTNTQNVIYNRELEFEINQLKAVNDDLSYDFHKYEDERIKRDKYIATLKEIIELKDKEIDKLTNEVRDLNCYNNYLIWNSE